MKSASKLSPPARLRPAVKLAVVVPLSDITPCPERGRMIVDRVKAGRTSERLDADGLRCRSTPNERENA